MKLALTTATALPLLLAALPAAAVCVETAPDSFDCTDLQTGGIEIDADDASVTVRSGAIVANDDGNAVEFNGDNSTVRNSGTLQASNDGVDGKTGLTVVNDGEIDVQGRGVDADDEDDVSVTNNGTINAPEDDGIRLGNGANASFDNSGSLLSGDEGFEAGDNAALVNRAGASIRAVEDAVQVGENAMISNEGLIESFDPEGGGDGIDMDSGIVINSGIISAVDGDGIDFDESLTGTPSVILNTGSISGRSAILVETDPAEGANTSEQGVVNSGTLTGTDGTALLLGAGNDALIVEVAEPGDMPAIFGTTDMGADDDRVGFFNQLTGGMIYGDGLDGLFDGGEGSDIALFSAEAPEFLGARTGSDESLLLDFSDGAMRQTLSFVNVEFFGFGADGIGADVALVSAGDLPPSPVPLPAGLVLLGAGLAGLSVLRRRS